MKTQNKDNVNMKKVLKDVLFIFLLLLVLIVAWIWLGIEMVIISCIVVIIYMQAELLRNFSLITIDNKNERRGKENE